MNGVVLLYHRVGHIAPDPFLLAVTPQHFAEHLRILRAHYDTLPLREMVRRALSGSSTEGTLAVTFDDGYSEIAGPVHDSLSRLNVHATAFISTGHIDGNREFMWDELEQIILSAGDLPDRLLLRTRSGEHDWALDSLSPGGGDGMVFAGLENNNDQDPDVRRRGALFRNLYWVLKYADSAERNRILDDVAAWRRRRALRRPSRRCLTAKEIYELSIGSTIECGAHTVTHPVLAALPLWAQRLEIDGSKRFLQAVTGVEVKAFAYPYGGVDDYSAATISIVRDCGFECACSTLDGSVRSDTDAFQLPRIDVKDWDGDKFARRLVEATARHNRDNDRGVPI